MKRDCDNCMHREVCALKGRYEALFRTVEEMESERPFSVGVHCEKFTANGYEGVRAFGSYGDIVRVPGHPDSY